MSNLVLRVEGLGKRYHMGRVRERHPTLRDRITGAISATSKRMVQLARGELSRASGFEEEFWALRDVSFEVERGERVGIIGHNGAGKSTLLKILSQITDPSEGQAEVWGRVGSLLEVGVGFHPELTGRENVFLSGAILGMPRRQIEARFDEIVSFSGVGELLDTPVKFYSSGMSVRLGFAIAAHLEPDILLTDEVLAVGDAAFQRKCLGKMGSAADAGQTVLFVSHQMDMIRALCDRCLLIEGGRLVADGSPEAVIERYYRGLASEQRSTAFTLEPDAGHALAVTGARVLNRAGGEAGHFDVFDPVSVEVELTVQGPIEGAIAIVQVKRNGGLLFQTFDADTDPSRLEHRRPGRTRERVTLPCPLLKPGHYTITLITGVANKGQIQVLEDCLAFDIELLSKPSSLVSYADKREGSLAVPLDWVRLDSALEPGLESAAESALESGPESAAESRKDAIP